MQIKEIIDLGHETEQIDTTHKSCSDDTLHRHTMKMMNEALVAILIALFSE